MKTVMKKLALAAGVTSALAGSMAAQAALQGLPGEAALVPFVLVAHGGPLGSSWAGYGDPLVGGSDTYINTVIRFQTALSVGNDTMIQFTAPHVMQGGKMSTQPVGLESQASPGWAVSTGNPAGYNKIHWILMSRESTHVYDDIRTVSADDVETFDVGRYMGDINVARFMGYLIAVTETAYTGNNAANFAFFTDAYLSATNVGEGEVQVASLPTLPMADGPDVTVRPTVYNEVITLNRVDPIASPIAAGIRTSGENPYRVFDVTLSGGRAGLQYPGSVTTATIDPRSSGTLVVTWNDRNLGSAGVWSGYAYDEEEDRVSRNIAVPRQLNTARAGFLYSSSSSCGSSSSPVVSLLCPASAFNPHGYDGDIPLASDGRTFATGEGFYKVFVPRPAGAATTGMSDSAMYAFSIPLVADDEEDHQNPAALIRYYDFYTNFWKAHDHGTFTGQ